MEKNIKVYIHLFFAIISLAFCFQSLSQNEEKQQKWKLGIYISPSKNFTLRLGTAEELTSSWKGTVKDEIIKPVYTISSGLSVEKQISKKLIIRTGFSITAYGDESTKHYNTPIGWEMTTTDTATSSSHYNNYLTYSYYKRKKIYAGVPLLIQYQLPLTKNISAFAASGFIFNLLFLVTERTDYGTTYYGTYPGHGDNHEYFGYYSPQNTSKIEYNFFNPTFSFSVGVDTKISKKSIFRIEPVFRCLSRPYLKNTTMKEFYYHFGLNVGLIF